MLRKNTKRALTRNILIDEFGFTPMKAHVASITVSHIKFVTEASMRIYVATNYGGK